MRQSYALCAFAVLAVSLGGASAAAPRNVTSNLAPVVIPAQPKPFFSWDRIPTAFHGADKSGPYSDDAVAQLAKYYQMVTCEKWYTPCAAKGPAQSGPSCDVEGKMEALFRRVRALNPHTTTMMYLNSMFDFSFYKLHAGMQALEAHGVRAFLRDEHGTVVDLCNDGGQYCGIKTFDWTHPRVRNLWLQAVTDATATGAVTGIFADHAAQEGNQIGSDKQGQGPNQLCNGKNSERRCFNFTDAFRDSFNSWHFYMTNKTQDVLSKSTGGPVMCGPLAQWFRFDCKHGHGFTQLRAKQAQYPVVEATHGGVPDESCLAAFLAAANKYSYLTLMADAPKPFPEMDRPLGKPDGPAAESKPGVWQRRFASGTQVTWNENTKTGKIAWGGVGI